MTGDMKDEEKEEEEGEKEEEEEGEASGLMRRSPCDTPRRRVIQRISAQLIHVSSALRPSLAPSLPCSLPQALAAVGGFLGMGHFVPVYGVISLTD